MAQLIDLGKLRFTFEGEYNPLTEYSTNQVVKYGANVYVYTSVTPASGNSPTNTAYWTLMLEGIDFKGPYDDEFAYKVGDVISFGGKAFVSVQPSTGVSPEDPGGDLVWSTLSDGIQYEGEWNSSTEYQTGDVVRYGGVVYICIDQNTNTAPGNTAYWSVFVEGVDYRGEYNSLTEYNLNDIVTYDGSSWISLGNTTGNTPSTTSAFWDVLAPGTFPSFTGNEGYFLSNDGTSVIWTADLAAQSLDIQEAFYVGNGAKEFALDEDENSEPLTNPVATFRFDNGLTESSFAQLAFQNADSSSSTDIIAYMDIGSDSKGWMGMGVTGSTFDDTTFGITAPGDGYLFLETAGDPGDFTGNMVFATGANGSENKIIFAAGGFDSGLTQMEITPDVNVHIEIPTPSISPSTGALTVVGGVGIQGDMNIQGNVDIVGQISFGGSGTTVTTQNLAVSDPVIFAGSNNLSDAVDLGLVGEYAEDVADQIISVTNKSLTSNVATLTTSVNHGYSVGDVVVITGVDATFNGTYIIKATPALNTFTYDKTAANVSSTAVSPAGTATVTHERRWAGVVRDVSDGATIKFFQGLTDKPTNTVDFANPNLSFAPIRAGAAQFTSVTATNITTSAGTLNLGGTVNISSAVNFTGSTSNNFGSGTWSGAPTFSGNLTFSGNPTFSGLATFTGGVRVQELVEDIVDVTNSSNTTTLDYNTGNIFNVTNNFSTATSTINITNAPTTDGRIFTINVFYNQGATASVPTTVNINGGGTTLRWAAASTPSGTANKIDIFTFTIIRRSGAWTVLGSANTNF